MSKEHFRLNRRQVVQGGLGLTIGAILGIQALNWLQQTPNQNPGVCTLQSDRYTPAVFECNTKQVFMDGENMGHIPLLKEMGSQDLVGEVIQRVVINIGLPENA
ncbi:MAG: hypothetical protein WC489_04435 [Patescibacteria group bacterium]